LPVHSAGILLYRGQGGRREVFLVHPGGPFWTKRDEGARSVPKGVLDPNEDLLAAARREFKEETGFEVGGEFHDLGILRQPSGERLHIWVLEGPYDYIRVTQDASGPRAGSHGHTCGHAPEQPRRSTRGSRIYGIEAVRSLARVKPNSAGRDGPFEPGKTEIEANGE